MTTLRTRPDGTPIDAPTDHPGAGAGASDAGGERYGQHPLTPTMIAILAVIAAAGLFGLWQVLVH